MSEREIENLPWWERDKLLTDKDRAAIDTARGQDWTEIDLFSAETIAGRVELNLIFSRKFHRDEYAAGMD